MIVQVTSSHQILFENAGKERLWRSRIKKGNHTSWHSSIIEGIKTHSTKEKRSQDERFSRVIK
jgi:hypothetical protein